MGKGVLYIYNIIFTELPLKTVSGDVTAFHRISILPSQCQTLADRAHQVDLIESDINIVLIGRQSFIVFILVVMFYTCIYMTSI